MSDQENRMDEQMWPQAQPDTDEISAEMGDDGGESIEAASATEAAEAQPQDSPQEPAEFVSGAAPFGEFQDPFADEQHPDAQTPAAATSDESSEFSSSLFVPDQSEDQAADRDEVQIIPAWRLGLLFCASLVTVFAVGGYAVFLVLGGKLAQLWPLDSEMLKIVLGAAGMTAGLGVLGAAAVGRAVTQAKRHYEAADSLTRALSDLRVDDRSSWQEESIRSHYGISRFLASVANSLDRKQSELNRYLGLEGELLRLEKALTGRIRDDLQASFENPTSGRLADEALQIHDEAVLAQNERQKLEKKLTQNGEPLCQKTLEAMRWNSKALDRLNVQVATLGKFNPLLKNWKQGFEQAAQGGQSDQRLEQMLQAVRENLSALMSDQPDQSLADLADTVKGLSENGGKLAIRLATEIGSLGQQGEPLRGAAEDLQSLANEFRAAAAQMQAQAAHQDGMSQTARDANQQLDALPEPSDAERQQAKQWHTMAVQVAELCKVLPDSLTKLSALPAGFNAQYERLADMGRTWAELTGAEFTPEQPPEPVAPQEFDAVMDEQASLATPDDKVSLVENQETALRDDEPSVSQSEDRIYDLNEFGAVAMDEEVPAGAAEEDRIYELSEFGAVALT